MLPVIAVEKYPGDLVVVILHRGPNDLLRRIAAAVVHQHDFVAPAEIIADRQAALQELGKIGLFVINRYDD